MVDHAHARPSKPKPSERRQARKAPAPAGLGLRGRRFWSWAQAEYEVTAPKRELLLEACRSLDEIDALETAIRDTGVMTEGSKGQMRMHPAITEIRQHRLALGRLLAQLDFEDEEDIPSPESLRGRRAAASRWAGHIRVADR